MKPDTRIVSHTFAMGAWTPDEVVLTNGEPSGYFWIVPAKVGGKWSVTGLPGIKNAQLNIVQKSQKFDAQLVLTEKNTQRIEGKLRGSRINFDYVDADGKLMSFIGEVGANKIHGSIKQQPNSVVTATKVQ
jgi:hypothetical protein